MDYINSRAAASLMDKIPLSSSTSAITAAASATLPQNTYDFHDSPLTHANNNFMYSNWIGLHTKSPLQANYLIGLQGMCVIYK